MADRAALRHGRRTDRSGGRRPNRRVGGGDNRMSRGPGQSGTGDPPGSKRGARSGGFRAAPDTAARPARGSDPRAPREDRGRQPTTRPVGGPSHPPRAGRPEPAGRSSRSSSPALVTAARSAGRMGWRPPPEHRPEDLEIASPALGLDEAVERVDRLSGGGVAIGPHPSGLAEAAPFAHQSPLAEEGRLDREGVVALLVLRRIDTTQPHVGREEVELHDGQRTPSSLHGRRDARL